MRPELRDADVERELARRAAGEWRPERVLAAVRQGTDTTSIRRPARRRVVATGLAAALVTVLLLVSTLPRIMRPAQTATTPPPAAQVTAEPTGEPSGPASPSPTPSAGLTETTTVWCQAEPARPGARDPLEVTVHDATDEVVACTSASGLGDGVWSEDFRGLAVLQNPGGDQQLLEVVVVASPCDRRADVTFWRGRFGHELLVYLPDEFSGCRGEAVYQRVMLELSEKVPVFDTSVSVRSVNWPEAGPTPQVPELPSGMRCHYADLPEMTPSVGITDTVGLINECTSFIGDRPAPDRFGVSVRNPAGNPDVLEVYWAIDSWCTDMPARLELSRSGDGYTLSVNQLTSSSACHSGASVQGVTLSLDAPLAAVDVLPELTITSATDLAATAPDEHFTLALTAGRDFYSAGERVDVLASLTYLGMDSPVDVYAFGSLIAFGVEQLDGGLQMLPVQRTIRTCTTYELLYSEPHLQPYIQSGVWMPDHAYMDDLQAGPELRLPPGLFRIYAFSGFSQDVCGEDGVEMEASVIVRVR